MSFDATLGKAEVEVRAPLDQLERDMAKARKTVAGSMKKIGKGMSSAGRKMSMGVTLPIVAMGAGIIKTAANFEQGMNRVRALTGATGSDFDRLRGQARELGSTTQFTAKESADAMGFLAMAGFNTNQILGAMPGTLQLAAAAQLDLAASADIVSNVLTGYQMDVAELSRVNDVLVKTFTSANVDLSMLGQAMKVAGPIAASIGLEFEEVSAAVGLFGNAGIQGAQAGTHLRNVIARLADLTPDAEKALKRLGVDKEQLVDSAGNVKSLSAVIHALGPHANRTKELVEIFGMRTGPMLAALLGQGGDALDEFTAELKESGGTAERIAETQMEGAYGAMKRLTSAVEGLALAIADSGLLEWFTGMVEKLTNFVQNLSKTNPKMLKLGTIIAGLVAAIGPLLMAIGFIASGLGALISVFSAVGGAIVAVGGTLAAITVGPIGLLLAAVGALVGVFWFFRDEIKLIAKFVWEDLKEYLQDKFKPIVDFLKDQTQLIIGYWKDVFTEIDDAVEEAGVAGKMDEYIVEPLKTSARGTADFMKSAFNESMDAIKLSLKTLADKFGITMPDISGLFDELGAAAKKAGEEIDKVGGVPKKEKFEFTPAEVVAPATEEELKALAKLENAWLRANDKQIELINKRRKAHIESLDDIFENEEAKAKAIVLINETADAKIAKIQERQEDRLKSFAEEFRDTFEGALTTFITDLQSGGDAFKNLGNTIVAEIQRIAAERLAAQIMVAAFGKEGEKKADFVSLGFQLLGAAVGAIGGPAGRVGLKKPTVTPAAGGPAVPEFEFHAQRGAHVMPGDVGLVGESGAELFKADRAGTIIPNSAMRAGEIGGPLRPIVVNQNIQTPDANSFRASQGQIAADTAQALRRADRRGN